MKSTFALLFVLVGCTSTVKGEGPGGSSSSSTSSTSSGSTTSSGSSGTSGTAGTSSSGSLGVSCNDEFDCRGIVYCQCPTGQRGAPWMCVGTCQPDCDFVCK